MPRYSFSDIKFGVESVAKKNDDRVFYVCLQIEFSFGLLVTLDPLFLIMGPKN